MQRARAQARRHRERLARRHRGWIAADALREQRRQPCFLEHVEVVVRSGPVGPDADVDAEFQHFGNGRDAGAELQVARRVVRDACAEILQRAYLSFVHVHTVRGQHLGAEQSLLFDIGHHRHAIHAPRLFDFEQRLREVRVQRHIEFRRELGAVAQDLRCAGIRRVRRGGGDDQRVIAPAADEIARARQAVLVAARIGRGETQHRLSAERAQSGGGRRLRNGFLEVIHVRKARDAGTDHLGASKRRSKAHELRRHELALDRHHVAHEPHIEPQVVGKPAQQRHRHVRVRVDEAGHDQLPRAVNPLGRLERRRRGSDGDDAVAGNGNAAGFMDSEPLVHGEDEGVSEQDIAARGHWDLRSRCPVQGATSCVLGAAAA